MDTLTDIERRRRAAQQQRHQQARQMEQELSRYTCPDFPETPYRVEHSNDPLNAKVQSVLGQFDVVKSLVNAPSCYGVPLMPLTPAAVLKDNSSLFPNISSRTGTPPVSSSTPLFSSGSNANRSLTGSRQSLASRGGAFEVLQSSASRLATATPPLTSSSRNINNRTTAAHSRTQPDSSTSSVSSSTPVIPSSDVLSSATINSDKTKKLKIQIPSIDSFNIDTILQDVLLPPQLSSIHTPTKGQAPRFPLPTPTGKKADCVASQLSLSESSDADSDVDVKPPPQPVKPLVIKSESTVKTEPVKPSVIKSEPAVKTEPDIKPANLPLVVDSKISIRSDQKLPPVKDSLVSSVLKLENPGLTFVDGRPSVVVHIPLVVRLRGDASENTNSTDVGAAAPSGSEAAVAVPVAPPPEIPAAVKGSQLARETIARIVGADAQLPARIKIPKRRRPEEDEEHGLDRGSRRSNEETGKRRRQSSPRNSPRCDSDRSRRSPRRDGDKRSFGRNFNRQQLTYNDFDEEVAAAFYEPPVPQTADLYGLTNIRDPYADFDPDITGPAEEAEERPATPAVTANPTAASSEAPTADPAAPVARRKFKDIGAQWGAMVTGDNKDSRRGGSRETRDDSGRDLSSWRDRQRNNNNRRWRDRSSEPDRSRRPLSPSARRTTSPASRTESSTREQGVGTSPAYPMVDGEVQTSPLHDSGIILSGSCDNAVDFVNHGHSEQDSAGVFLPAALSPSIVRSTEPDETLPQRVVSDFSAQCPLTNAETLKKNFNSSLKAPDHYYHQARLIKHQGSQKVDVFQRSLCFLESALMFVEHCYCLERKKLDPERLYTTYEDVLKMCLIIGSRALKDGVTRTPKWYTLDALSLRVQSYIRQQMWKLKIADCQRKKEAIDGFFRGKVSGAEACSTGSVKSDSGSSVDSPAGAVPGQTDTTVPSSVLSSVREYMHGVENLVAASQLWDKANNIINSTCREFIASVNLECCEVTRDSHLSTLAVNVRATIDRLRELD